MCKECVVEECPDRGTVVLETGVYYMNIKACKECGSKSFVNTENKTEINDEENSETITFNHVCEKCGHVVAKHSYFFSHDDEVQYYAMNCILCGRANDSRCIDPVDPTKMRSEIF